MVKACFNPSCFKAFFFRRSQKVVKEIEAAIETKLFGRRFKDRSELNIELHLATNEQDGHTDFCGPVRDKVAKESQTNEMQTHVEFGTQTYEPQQVEGVTQTHEPQAKVEFGAHTELINLRFEIDQ